jgi:2-polyprenyl-3-methyl-5-hydroxy-6-metoxy-1,4-benzoquinol methylase
MCSSASGFRLLTAGVAAAILLFPDGAVAAGDREPSAEAREILQETGVRGGLIVHLGCADGRLTAALRAGEGVLVHGLEADPERVDAARQYVQSRGLYGPVSIDPISGSRLP